MNESLLRAMTAALGMPGITQDSLSRSYGSSPAAISRIKRSLENGEDVDPPARLVVRLAEILGLTTDEVLGFEDNKAAVTKRDLEKRLARVTVERDLCMDREQGMVDRIVSLTESLHTMERKYGRAGKPVSADGSLEMMGELTGDIDRVLDRD